VAQPRWWSGRTAAVLDGLLAAALAGLGLAELLAWLPADGPAPRPLGLAVTAVVLSTAALAVRRRWPLAVAVGIFAVQIAPLPLPSWAGTPFWGGAVPAGVALYSVARHTAGHTPTRALLLPAALLLAYLVWLPGFTTIDDVAFLVLSLGAAWGAGRLLTRAQESNRRLAMAMDALERESAVRERAAAMGERARVAREQRCRERAGGDAGAGLDVRRADRRRSAGARLRRPRVAAGRGAGVSTRIVVADDQALVRAGFRSILDRQGDLEVVGEAGDGVEAVEVCRATRPDVVLMDVRMPRADGLEATRRLMADRDPPRVLILTTFDLDEYVYAALKVGASGFLLKDASPERLVDGVRAVASGDSLLAPSVTKRVIETYVSAPPPSAGTPAALAALTDREREVLVEIAAGRSNAEIAAALHLSEATVKTHVTRVLTKLGLRDRVQAVVLAYECGFVRPGDTRKGATG